MKIRAIRLKEVGRFSEPIALEGLSGGLDVLSGPNELGKSTILEAVKLTLFEKYSSTKQEIEVLRPYAGGAPLIEVDFEIEDATWRIRKQFLAGRSAELCNLRTGSLARGADAETELAKLLSGRQQTNRFALLWVDQGTALARLDPVKTAGSALHALIENEVESVADGGSARFVGAQLKAELAEFMSAHATPRPAGRYKAALDEQNDLGAKLAAAQTRLTATQERLRTLETLRAQISALADPGAVSVRSKAGVEAKRVLDEATAAQQQMQQAAEALDRQEELLGARKSALEALQGQLADLSKFEEASAREAPQLAELTKRLGEQESRTEGARKKRDGISGALTTAEREGKAHDMAARLREAGERLAAARLAAGERKDIAAAIAANGAEDRLLAVARSAGQSIATLSARLTAAAPKVSISYSPGGAGKIRIDGKALAHGEALHPTRAIALEIEGVGVITIAPGQSEGADDDAGDIAAQEAQLGELLRRMGALSLEDAEARAQERRALQARLAEATAQVEARAPEGLERLVALHADLVRRAPLLGPAPTLPQEELGDRIQKLSDAFSGAVSEFSDATAERDTLLREQAKLRTLAAERGASIKTLTASLGDAAARQLKSEKLTAALAGAEVARNAAAHRLTVWRAAAPDEVRFVEIKHAADAAEGVRAKADRELIELRQKEAGIRGQLIADRAEDVASIVAELNEARAAADERVRRLAEEVAALQLLGVELEKASAEKRAHFAQPVVDRLLPYLQLVFPDAEVHLGDGFALEALQRAGRRERLERLSHGTREQLAVLVRLGFGRLLSEAGTAAPLILDDALVYSDDTRIERMFAALKLAAQSHQVLVLTCRERTFATLGGNRVAIVPWR